MSYIKNNSKQNELPFQVVGKSSKKNVSYTAGAVPVLNEKGQLTMEKVNVKRYVAGKKPDYVRESDSDSECDESVSLNIENDSDNLHYKKEPCNIIYQSKDQSCRNTDKVISNREEMHSNSDQEDDEDDEAIERRRNYLRIVSMQNQQNQQEILEYEKDEFQSHSGFLKPNQVLTEVYNQTNDSLSNNKKMISTHEDDIREEEEEEYEDEDDYSSDASDDKIMFKPVFIKKTDRHNTVNNATESLTSSTILNLEDKKSVDLHSQRRKDSRLLIQDIIKEEIATHHGNTKDEVVLTDDGEDEDETNFQLWKIRELMRIKKEADRKEQAEEDKRNIERLRNMTEEERLLELKLHPKIITNKQEKGKYAFLQKYFHRGAYYLDEEDEVFKRNFAAPTLDDHFDKLVVPKVMQVKNFGQAGRTKYTHLVDQDTTKFDSAWVTEKDSNTKFTNQHCAGFKQKFTRPARK